VKHWPNAIEHTVINGGEKMVQDVVAISAQLKEQDAVDVVAVAYSVQLRQSPIFWLATVACVIQIGMVMGSYDAENAKEATAR